MHIKIHSETTEEEFTLPLNAIGLRKYINYSNEQCYKCVVALEFANVLKPAVNVVNDCIIEIAAQEYARLENAIKNVNVLECEDVNNKAGKEIISRTSSCHETGQCIRGRRFKFESW